MISKSELPSYKLFAVYIVILVFGVFTIKFSKNNTLEHQYSNARLGLKTFVLKNAITDIEKQNGLSNIESISEREGMLFIYDAPSQACFWMKGMKFNIDILWFDENFRLIHIEKNLSPDSYPKSYCPNKNSLYVVEILPGQIVANLGDRLIFQKQ